MQQEVNAFSAGARAVEHRRADVFLWTAANHVPEQPGRHPLEPVPVTTPTISVPVAAVPQSLDAVMSCIKGAESGNYAESSHPSSGSGAYQFTPSTWASWSARAGYPGYAYAYQAPASVQDAVTAFTLSNGGAHNWDPSYGADSCTVGLP